MELCPLQIHTLVVETDNLSKSVTGVCVGTMTTIKLQYKSHFNAIVLSSWGAWHIIIIGSMSKKKTLKYTHRIYIYEKEKAIITVKLVTRI